MPPPYDPSPTAYSEIKSVTITTETYDKVCHNGGHTHHSLAGTTSNNGTYSRLNVGAAPIYDKCQHNSSVAVPQGQYSEYSKLNVGQSSDEPPPVSQYSTVATDNTPLVHKGNSSIQMPYS